MTGVQRKLFGMRLAASKHKVQLEHAQGIARILGKSRVSVTIEDVRDLMNVWGQTWLLGNAAGSVFDGGNWECVGFTTAKRPEAHGRVLRQWRLRK